MMLEATIVRCPSCGANNRVRRETQTTGARFRCGRCKTELTANAVPSAEPVHLTDATLSIDVDASPIPVLIDLWAEWCGPCRMLAPTIEQLARELTGRVKVGKLNVDENPRGAARFGAHSIPTLVLVANGKEVDRLVGLLPKLEIQRWLEQNLARVPLSRS